MVNDNKMDKMEKWKCNAWNLYFDIISQLAYILTILFVCFFLIFSFYTRDSSLPHFCEKYYYSLPAGGIVKKYLVFITHETLAVDNIFCRAISPVFTSIFGITRIKPKFIISVIYTALKARQKLSGNATGFEQ